MILRSRGAAAVCLALLAAGCAAQEKTTSPPPVAPTPSSHVTVTTEKTIPLPGSGGHGDVVAADPAAHAVYVAQSPDNNLVVIDTDTNTVKTVVPNVASANGVVYTNEYVFVAEAPSGAVAVISKANWQVVATVSSGGKTPDALYYDSKDNSVFVANDDSNNMEEFSAAAPFTVLGSPFDLSASPATSGPDLGTYVPSQNVIYQADDNNVLVIDAGTRRVDSVYPLPLDKGGAAKDMYYDQAKNLLWVATTGPDVLAIDPGTGKVVHTVKTASGADQVAADTDDGLLLLGEGKAGAMAVVDLATYRDVSDVKEEPEFHTLDYLPNSHLVYAYLNKSNAVAVEKVTVGK